MNGQTQTYIVVGGMVLAAAVAAYAVNQTVNAAQTGINTAVSDVGNNLSDATGHLIFDGGIVAVAGLLLIFL